MRRINRQDVKAPRRKERKRGVAEDHEKRSRPNPSLPSALPSSSRLGALAVPSEFPNHPPSPGIGSPPARDWIDLAAASRALEKAWLTAAVTRSSSSSASPSARSFGS